MISKNAITRSIQDYLKTIYSLSDGEGTAGASALAARLGVAAASVTGMVQRMARTDPPLVAYRKHQGVRLTAAGRRAALQVIRRHRLLETYLVAKLGYSWDEVHPEAERLEHAASDGLEARIDAALGHPSHDPHGEPIPNANLAMPGDTSRPLSALRLTQRGVVVRVNGEDPAFFRHLDDLGLIPGAHVVVTGHSPFDRNLTVRIGKKSNVLGPPITSRVFVKISEPHDVSSAAPAAG
jgi:DtxR family Mn-dependent transcriptional regulator